MGRKVLFNGKIRFKDCINVKLDSPALNYGFGLFETVLYENGKIFFLYDHINRLKSACTALNIPEPNINYIKESLILDLLEQNKLIERSARIKILYAPLFDKDEWVTIIFNSLYKRNEMPLSVRADIFPRENYFCNYKSISYMQNMHLKTFQCNSNRYDEALFINSSNKITEGTMSNILCIKDDILYYVDKKENYLKGVMQERIITDSLKLGFTAAVPVKNGIGFDLLKECSEAIITNSLIIAANISNVSTGTEILEFSPKETSRRIREFYL